MATPKEIRDINRAAWDGYAERGNRWSIPVSPEEISAAKRGEWAVYLTEPRPVPREWFPELSGLDVLALASGEKRPVSSSILNRKRFGWELPGD